LAGLDAEGLDAKSNWKFSGLVAFAADREASGRSWAHTDQTQTVRSVPADHEVAAMSACLGKVLPGAYLPRSMPVRSAVAT